MKLLKNSGALALGVLQILSLIFIIGCDGGFHFVKGKEDLDVAGRWIIAPISSSVADLKNAEISFFQNGDFECRDFPAVASYFPELKFDVISTSGRWRWNLDRSEINVTFNENRRGVTFFFLKRGSENYLCQLTDLDFIEGFFFIKNSIGD